MAELLLLDIILMFMLLTQGWIALELNSIKNELRWWRWQMKIKTKEKEL